MRRRGYVIYPGKLTAAPSFRIGCIGRLGPAEMRGALAAVEGILEEMGVASGAPGVSAPGCSGVAGDGDAAVLQTEP